jgi:hypothetical protein
MYSQNLVVYPAHLLRHPSFLNWQRAKPQELSKDVNETRGGLETRKDTRQSHSVDGQPKAGHAPPDKLPTPQTRNHAVQVYKPRICDGDVLPGDKTDSQKHEQLVDDPAATLGRARSRKRKPTASDAGVQAGESNLLPSDVQMQFTPRRKSGNSERPRRSSGQTEKHKDNSLGLAGEKDGYEREIDQGSENKRSSKRIKKVGPLTTVPSRSLERDRKIVDQELDHENWAIKDIVRWGNARERRMEKEKKEKAKLKEVEAGDLNGMNGQKKSNTQAIGSPGKQFPSSLAERREEEMQQAVAPQVTVVEGKIVVNRHSLTVQAQEKQEYTRVVTEDANKLNSMTYMSRISNERWSAEDTELFYKAVSQFGTDFTLITHLFPGRQRRHLKNKFTRESKINPMRIDEALRASAQATIHSYKEMIAMLKESGTDIGNNKEVSQDGEMLQLEDAKTAGEQPARSGPRTGRRKNR